MSGHAILRSTGFPWEMLDVLGHPETTAALEHSETAEQNLSRALDDLVNLLRLAPPLSAPDNRRLRKKLSRRQAIDPAALGDQCGPEVRTAAQIYETAREGMEEASAAIEEHLSGEITRVHRDLVAWCTDPAVREAIWLSSPSMHDRGITELTAALSAPERGAARRLRRQFASYLQRFVAKNETTSFFGPITYAEFGAAPHEDDPRTGPAVQRAVSLSFWACTALAAAIADDPQIQPHLVPRRSPMLTSGPPWRLGGRPVTLPARVEALLAAVDGSRTAAEVAAVLGTTPQNVISRIQQACHRRLLEFDLRPPVTTIDALGWLQQTVAGLPGGERWAALLEALATDLADFARADLPRRQELLGGLEKVVRDVGTEPARRGGGQWYADRLVLHEEALGPLSPLPLGPDLRQSLEQRLAPALTVLAGEGVARLQRLTEEVLRAHPGLLDGEPLTLLELLTGPQPPAAPDELLTSAAREIDRQVDEADPRQPLYIDPDRLPPVDLGPDPLIVSPDLMFGATDLKQITSAQEPIDLVLAEAHDTMLLWGWALQLHDEPGQVRRTGSDLLTRAANGTVLATVTGSRRAKIVPFDFPGPVVGLSGLPADPSRHVPAADVQVRWDGTRLVATVPGTPRLLLHHGELDSPLHNVLAPPRVRPVRFGSRPRSPRVVIGDVVVSRARWSISPHELFPGAVPEGENPKPPSPLALVRAAKQARARWDLPRLTYLKVPGERKPVLLDLQAPALLDLAWHLCRSAPVVHLTEMLPTPEQLWLRDDSGRRRCSELRTTMVLDRTAEPL